MFEADETDVDLCTVAGNKLFSYSNLIRFSQVHFCFRLHFFLSATVSKQCQGRRNCHFIWQRVSVQSLR